MGLLSRLFSKKGDEPSSATAANDSAPKAASTPPDEDTFPVPEAIRQFLIEQHGFDPVKNPLRPSVICPEAHARSLEERRKQEELKNLKPGQMMPDGTIYLGRYSPVDRDGVSLAKTFNVFAAPEDLPETVKYVEAVEHITKLEKWHGYDGTNYPTDKEIYAALKDGSYNGGWIIPTRDILHGKDVDGKDTTPDNILSSKDKGAFKDKKHAFKMAASRDGSDYPFWYWSSTEDRDSPSCVWDVRLSNGDDGWFLKNNSRLSCRPVRLVPVGN